MKTAIPSAPLPPLDPWEMVNVSRIRPQRSPGPLLGGTRGSPEASKRLQEASRGFQEASRGLPEPSKSTLKPPEQLPGPEISCISLDKSMKSNAFHEIHCWVFTCCQGGPRSSPGARLRRLWRPMGLQDGPKSSPRDLQESSRSLQEPPRSLLSAPRGLPEPPKSLPGSL